MVHIHCLLKYLCIEYLLHIMNAMMSSFSQKTVITQWLMIFFASQRDYMYLKVFHESASSVLSSILMDNLDTL